MTFKSAVIHMKGNDQKIHDDAKGGEDEWQMVISQGEDMREKLRNLSIIDPMFIYL